MPLSRSRARLRPAAATLAAAALVLASACTASVPGAAASTPTPSATTPAATARPVLPLPANGRFDYQIGGAYAPAAAVRVVDRDRAERPVAGRYNVCYVNAFQTQPDEKTYWTTRHPDLLVRKSGRLVTDPDWPGEYLLDTSTAAHRKTLAAIVGGWVDGCAAAGYQAVEPDNLDSWTRSRGRLSRAHNVAFATLLVRRAHAAGLAIAQKNAVELGRTGRTAIGFDFAVAEECQVYDECAGYTDVYGDRVVEIEYTDNARRFFTAACRARGARIAVLLRDRDVVARGAKGYHDEAC